MTFDTMLTGHVVNVATCMYLMHSEGENARNTDCVKDDDSPRCKNTGLSVRLCMCGSYTVVHNILIEYTPVDTFFIVALCI